MSRSKLILLVVTLIVVAVAATVLLRKSTSPIATPLPTSSPSVPPTVSVSPLTNTTSKPQASFVGPTGLTEPASCALSGSIEFIEKNIFASHQPLISYKNVDSDARLINWSIQPNEKLIVGPNLFANLDVPHGERAITVALPAQPSSRTYTLKAAITYGQLIGRNVVVKTVPCSGSILVLLKY